MTYLDLKTRRHHDSGNTPQKTCYTSSAGRSRFWSWAGVGLVVARMPRGASGREEFHRLSAVTRDDWPEKEALLAGMGNAVNGSLRG